jgi:LmbE family N-acetylglucosaminyl deacetylase
MLRAQLSGVRSVVLLGAHPDDLEIGAGGLMLSLPPGTTVHYVLFTGTPVRHAEARAAVAAFLPAADVEVELHHLPDGRLPAYWSEVKEILEAAARHDPADLVVAPTADDAHQDHRLIGELVGTAFRDTLVLQYEIAKSDGDLGQRNVYLPLTEDLIRRKVALLNDCYPSQKDRHWWSEEIFLGLARLRGVECASRYAEAYTCRRLPVTL